MYEKLSVDRDMLLYAFRYAIGRSSYAPINVVNNIKANINKVSTGDIQAYIREINECEHYSMKMDERFWLEFKQYLEEELAKRQ